MLRDTQVLNNLWNKGWEAEENDRAEEAKKLFQEVLNRSKDVLNKPEDVLIRLPRDLKCKQYETLASLKIEGNQLFNEGMESQQKGVKLLAEARTLEQQQQYNLANTKFKEAKGKLSASMEKFAIGNQSDQRFESCIQFVQEQITEVEKSIITTEQHQNPLNQALNNLHINIDSNDLVQDEFYNCTTIGDNNDHHQHI